MAISDLLAQISGDAPTSTSPLPRPLPQAPKRRAEDRLSGPSEKLPRRDTPPTSISKPISQVQRSSTTVSTIAKPRDKIVTSQTSKPSIPSPITSRPSPATPAKQDANKAPPKKGSYAEIMARAKAAQANMGQVGKIQHKRVEKGPSKRERVEARLQKPNGSSTTNGKSSMTGRSAATDSRVGGKANGQKTSRPSTADQLPEKKPKKAATATTGYTGTARPNPATMKSAYRSSTSGRSTGGRYRDERDEYSSQRYRYASEEEDEEEDDEREYYSDASSDMEAAAFEVDEEERLAERLARKEDEQALREEMEHKRMKEEKRRKLAAMASRR